MLTRMPFHSVGISHRTAGVAVRERLTLTAESTRALLEAEHAAGRSLLILSTCNRFELYWWGDHDLEPRFREFVAGRTGDGVVDAAPAIARRDGRAAAEHLFRVAAGLESQILGEAEILGQVRRALELSRETGAMCRELELIIGAALAAGRRVRHETLLGRHPLSVSAAAVRLLAREAPEPGRRTVVVLGAGEAAAGVLQALEEAGDDRVIVINRDRERARRLAAEHPIVEPRPWSALDSSLADADVLVAATAAPCAVLSAEQVAAAKRTRPDRDLLLVDLCVPRNVEGEARLVPGVRVADLDDLQRRFCPSQAPGTPALDGARAVLARELARLDETLRSRALAPHLSRLHALGARLAAEEAEAALEHLSLSGQEQEVVRRMAERLVRRVLYPASRAVRAGALLGREPRGA